MKKPAQSIEAIARKAIRHFGKPEQAVKAVEEMGELIAAIQREILSDGDSNPPAEAGVSTWKHAKRWHLWTEHGFGVEVCQHSEKTEEERGFYDFPCAWNTYLFFSDKLHFSRDGKLCEPYVEPDPFTSYLWEHRDALNCLEGWNGSPTFHEFVTNERGQRRIKIGDDFMHFWDRENRHFELYDLGYMQRRVMRTAAEAAELLRLVRRMEGV